MSICIDAQKLHLHQSVISCEEPGCSVIECLTQDQGVVGSSNEQDTSWPPRSTGSTQADPSIYLPVHLNLRRGSKVVFGIYQELTEKMLTEMLRVRSLLSC